MSNKTGFQSVTLWINKIVDNKEIEKDGPGNRGKP